MNTVKTVTKKLFSPWFGAFLTLFCIFSTEANATSNEGQVYLTCSSCAEKYVMTPNGIYDGASVKAKQYDGSSSQIFFYDKTNQNLKLKSNPKYCIGLKKGGKKQSHTDIVLRNCSINAWDKQWKVEDNGLICLKDDRNYCLDKTTAQFGHNVHLFSRTGKINQIWNIGYLRKQLNTGTPETNITKPVSNPKTTTTKKTTSTKTSTSKTTGNKRYQSGGNGIDLNAWCQDRGYRKALPMDSGSAYSWKCYSTSYIKTGIDIEQVCKAAYGDNYITNHNPYNAYSWECIKRPKQGCLKANESQVTNFDNQKPDGEISQSIDFCYDGNKITSLNFHNDHKENNKIFWKYENEDTYTSGGVGQNYFQFVTKGTFSERLVDSIVPGGSLITDNKYFSQRLWIKQTVYSDGTIKKEKGRE